MSKEFKFLNDDVIVSVPTDKPKKLKAIKLDDLGNPDMNPTSGDFTPIRVVANIVLEEEGKPGTYLTDLGQSVEIKIRYTKKDKAAADASFKPLALAFWDGNRWVRFVEKHGFVLLPDPDPEKGGVGKVSITRWGDPPISWGK
jgi:hypothetical protein